MFGEDKRFKDVKRNSHQDYTPKPEKKMILCSTGKMEIRHIPTLLSAMWRQSLSIIYANKELWAAARALASLPPNQRLTLPSCSEKVQCMEAGLVVSLLKSWKQNST